MVFISQCVIFHILQLTIGSPLGFINFLMLSFCTILIAASGYVINDVFDVEIDAINKPEKQIVGKSITEKTANYIYGLLVILGFAIAIYLAYHLEKFNLLILFPAATGLLYLYARWFKKSFLVGNILVSVFVAAVPLIIVLGAFDSFQEASSKGGMLIKGIYIYSVFGFIANLLREIVKDVEDQEGDKIAAANTLALQWGERKAKGICLALVLLLIIGLALYIFQEFQDLSLYFLTAISIVLIFNVWIAFQLNKAQHKNDYHKISTNIKLMMLCGLISLYIWTI